MSGLFQLPVLLAAVQWVVGAFLKKQPWFGNWLIPGATYVIGVLGYTLAPKEANAATTLAGVVGTSSIFLTALLQNLLVVGTHSTYKNMVAPALLAIFKRVPGRGN